MAHQILTLDQITPNTPFPWKARVLIAEKGYPRDPLKSPSKYQRLILVDSNGTRAQATIFGRDIDALQNTLLVLRHYYISNAIVRIIQPKHRVVPNQYQWIITTSTIIEDAIDEAIIPVVAGYEFLPFSSIPPLRDTASQVDLIGAIVKASPSTTKQTKNGPSQIQEFLLVDRELQSMPLTIWNQFVDNEGHAIAGLVDSKPIIACLRVKAVSYRGISVASRITSSFLINPNIPQAVELRSIIAANGQAIDRIIADSNNQIHINEDIIKKEEVQIAALDMLPDNITFIVNCSVTPTDIDKQMWYIGCSNCFKTINAAPKQFFTCYNCPAHNTQALPRARVGALLRDKTGIIQATFFGSDAEKVICCTADILANTIEEKNQTDIMALINTETQLNQKVQVRASQFISGGKSNRRFTASFLALDSEEVGESSASTTMIELHNELQQQEIISSATIAPNNLGKEKTTCIEKLPMDNPDMLDAEFDANTGEIILCKNKSPAEVEENNAKTKPTEIIATKGKELNFETEVQQKDISSIGKKILPEKKDHARPFENIEVTKKTRRLIKIPNDDNQPC